MLKSLVDVKIHDAEKCCTNISHYILGLKMANSGQMEEQMQGTVAPDLTTSCFFVCALQSVVLVAGGISLYIAVSRVFHIQEFRSACHNYPYLKYSYVINLLNRDEKRFNEISFFNKWLRPTEQNKPTNQIDITIVLPS